MSSGAAPRTDPPRRRYAPRLPPAQRREQLLDATLTVILEHGYAGVSIEAVARTAGVTRPVVYDHFPDLERLLHALVQREEAYAVAQLEQVVPEAMGDGTPAEVLASGMRLFLDAVLARPATWRVILLSFDGTPQLVRDHIEMNRRRIDERIARLIGQALLTSRLGAAADVELAARMIRNLGEDAGRMALIDSERFSPERYARFIAGLGQLVWPAQMD